MNEQENENEQAVCLDCGRRFPTESMTRGLCPADYHKFVRAKKKAKPTEIAAFEAYLIAQGKLLPDGRSSDNTFEQALQAVREESAKFQEQPKTLESIKPEIDKFISKAVAKTQSSKTPRAARKKGAQ